MCKVYFFSFFSSLIDDNRAAPLASESLSLYLKEVLDDFSKEKNIDVEFVNLAISKKPFVIEKNKSQGNRHQIGTKCFGRIYRKYLLPKVYWKSIYQFCKKRVSKDDVLIFYHSLLNNHLFKALKKHIKCKIILLGAELYSDVSNKKADRKKELESYSLSNGLILISEVLNKKLNLNKPYSILSGDYRKIDVKEDKFSEKDGKIHLVYSGTFDIRKGGVYRSIDSLKYLDDNYILHILGFGNVNKVRDYVINQKLETRVVFDGTKSGQDFLNFLSKCNIGLSVQKIEEEFNNSSFPSKVITYLKCGLSVIATPSISIIESPFKNMVNLTDGDDGKSISEVILRLNLKEKHENSLDSVRSIFKDSFYQLLESVLNSKRYLFTNNCSYGSTGNLCKSICRTLENQGNDVMFCFYNGKKESSINWKRYGCRIEHYSSPFLSRITGNSLGYMFFSTEALKRITKRFEPDLINVHCMNSYSVNIFKYLSFLKKYNKPTIITNHALFYATGSCGYPYGDCKAYLSGCGNCPNKRYACKSYVIDRTHKNWNQMKKAFDDSGFNMISVSDYVKDICGISPITSHIGNKTILNGIDTGIFLYKDLVVNDGHIHILHVNSSPKGANKGLDNLLEIIKVMEKDSDFVFDLVGKGFPDLSNQKNVKQHCFISKPQELSNLYNQSSLYLITSRKETFSLPVAESLCCGTPIVGFKCGGPESFAPKEYSQFYEYGDVDSVVDYIRSKKYLSLDKKEISKICIKQFDNKTMITQYIDFFKEVVNNN